MFNTKLVSLVLAQY